MKLVKLATITTFALSALAFSNTAQADVSYRAIKLNHECGGGDTILGAFNFTEECATACENTDGCEYFIFGKGDKKGHCYHEDVDVTEGGQCSGGWEKDAYDFYAIENGSSADQRRERGSTAHLLIEESTCGNGEEYKESAGTVSDCADACGGLDEDTVLFFSYGEDGCLCAGNEEDGKDDECQLKFDEEYDVYVALPHSPNAYWWERFGDRLSASYKYSYQYTWEASAVLACEQAEGELELVGRGSTWRGVDKKWKGTRHEEEVGPTYRDGMLLQRRSDGPVEDWGLFYDRYRNSKSLLKCISVNRLKRAGDYR